MPNTLVLTVEEPDKLLNAGAYGAAAVMRLQWSATDVGAFVDVSGTGSTPTITVLTGTRSYDAYDPNGTVSTWYRTRFENVGATRLSDWSDPFQVAPEGSGLICSLWDVKQELGRTGAIDTVDDELLLEKIRQVSAEIRERTGQDFAPDPVSGTVIRLFDGFDAERDGLVLKIPDGIRSISTLEIAQFTGGSFATIPSSDYFLRPQLWTMPPGSPFTRLELTNYPSSANTRPAFYDGYANIRVTGAFGWAAIPYNIQAVAQRVVVASFLSKGSGVGGVAAIGPSGSMRILRYISPADHETLMRYSTDPIAVG